MYTLATSSRGPTTSTRAQEATVDGIRLIDTPGLSWKRPSSEEEEDVSAPTDQLDLRARDILIRSKGRIDRLKDPNPPGTHSFSSSPYICF